MVNGELQEKYVFYQLLQQNLEALKQQLELVEKQFLDIRTTAQALGEVKNIEGKNEIMIPLGSGVYGSGSITERGKVLVDLGAGVMVKKDLDSATLFLKEKGRELEKISEKIQKEMGNVINKMNEVGSEIQTLSKEGGKE